MGLIFLLRLAKYNKRQTSKTRGSAPTLSVEVHQLGNLNELQDLNKSYRLQDSY
jgi:hypothetical protein